MEKILSKVWLGIVVFLTICGLTVVAHAEEKLEVKDIYLDSFTRGFANGYKISRGLPPSEETLLSIRCVAEKTLVKQLIPQLTKDGVLEEWERMYLDPKFRKLEESLIESKNANEIIERINTLIIYGTDKYPRLFKVMNNAEYAQITADLERVCRATIMGK